MKSLLYLLTFVSLAMTPTVFAEDTPETGAQTTDPDAALRSRALSVAERQCPAYFVKHYQGIGEELDCGVQLDEPTPVQGWTGRFRIHGRATLGHYKDRSANSGLAQRENSILTDRNLTPRQKQSQVNSLFYIRSEIVEFEVEVSNLDSTPEIDVTVR